MMRWKLALAQHPMYLLIREDTQCAERTPPWGAPAITDYIERVRQNLDSLERYPHLKLGYEWSGVELELLAQDAPDVLQLLRGYADEGRVSFYNGTYAQPHLQILSGESNLRQFQFGQKVYRELGLAPVAVYAHQEVSLHDQVPQLLRAFDIPLAVVPGFLTNLVWLDAGELLLHGVRGPRFTQGNEFTFWCGLDGSQIPLYLHQPIPREMTMKEMLAREFVLGRLSAPRILIDMPDMIAIDDAWMDERSAVDFCALESVLLEQLVKRTEHPKARLYTNWSYLEGIRAEELSRCDWQAEREALRAEALISLAYILNRKAPESTDPIWQVILKCQHHDVYCFSAPELREKSIGWLRATAQEAHELSDKAVKAFLPLIQTDANSGDPVVIISTTPRTYHGLVEHITSIQNPLVVDSEGQPVPCDYWQDLNGLTKVSFLSHAKGLGYSTYWIRSSQKKTTTGRPADTPIEFENQFYRAVISPDGTFSSIKIMPSGRELVDISKGFGNSLSATDSSAISLNEETQDERIERYLSYPPVRGPSLVWNTTDPGWVRHSPLGMVFSVSGYLGDTVKADLMVRFYHELARIDITWIFNFQRSSIGTYFDDDSKLLARWPMAVEGKISHDIPFGVIQERENRPFFPTSWVDHSDGEVGLAFFHQGTSKHWVSDRTLFNLLAWGEQTDAIHNGLGSYQWPKSFDQRLDGLHTIRHAVYPHPGDWGTADIPRAAREYGFQPVVYPALSHPGKLPPVRTVLDLLDASIAPTSIRTDEKRIICRVYAAYGQVATGLAVYQGLQQAALQLLSGEQVDHLQPYQIGELQFTVDNLQTDRRKL